MSSLSLLFQLVTTGLLRPRIKLGKNQSWMCQALEQLSVRICEIIKTKNFIYINDVTFLNCSLCSWQLLNDTDAYMNITIFENYCHCQA